MMLRRYYIKYSESPPWQFLPMQGKDVRDMFTANGLNDGMADNVVGIDEINKWINICLSIDEAGIAKENGLDIHLDYEVKPKVLGIQYYISVENEGVLYPDSPAEKINFLNGSMQQDRNYERWTPAGRLEQATALYMRVNKFHDEGILGQGLVMVFVDDGYSTEDSGHEMLQVRANQINQPTGAHAIASATLACGRNIAKGFVSMAPEAGVLMASYDNAGAAIAWGLSQKQEGERMIFVLPFLGFPDAYYREMVALANDNDCLVFVSSGNNKSTPGTTNPMCIQGTIAVGGLIGGNNTPFTDQLAFLNYIANSDNKTIDVVVPHLFFSGTTPDPDSPYVAPSDYYSVYDGTSAACIFIGAFVGLYGLKYPNRTLKACYNISLLKGRMAAGYHLPKPNIL